MMPLRLTAIYYCSAVGLGLLAAPLAAAAQGGAPSGVATSTGFAQPQEFYNPARLKDPFLQASGAVGSVGAVGAGGGGMASRTPGAVSKREEPLPATSGGAQSPSSEPQGGEEEFDIHKLVLKGILRGMSGDMAILVELESGQNFILKKGRLYDAKKKHVHGITGIIKPRQKTVHLMTLDKDVQTLVLGEEEKEREGL